MSTTFDARDGDPLIPSPPGLVLADEESLRQTFLSEYPALTEEARADLGPDAEALVPKVVEGSFVRAWDARERFKTPQEVHQFLVEDVHHAAARALSRRAAAHRLKHNEHVEAHVVKPTTPEESWDHILKALHGEAHSPKALSDLAAHSRHEAAQHIEKVGTEGPPWVPIGIGAAVLIAVLGYSAWSRGANEGERIAAALASPNARSVNSRTAQVGSVTLDDGSTVRLAPESRLVIARGFGPELRAVRLQGMATFTVAQDKPKPFHVHAGDVAIVATGTSFTVRADSGVSAVTVVVTEGSVRVGEKDDDDGKDVAAGNAIVVMGDSSRPASPIERSEAEGWQAGTMSVADRPLREVLPMLRRWYGVTIAVQPDSLAERRVTLSASLDSTRQAIRGIEQSARLRFGYVGQNMVLTDSAATPTAKTPAKTPAPARR